jgi:hypothetical protein
MLTSKLTAFAICLISIVPAAPAHAGFVPDYNPPPKITIPSGTRFNPVQTDLKSD